jgi:hypothetical protein
MCGRGARARATLRRGGVRASKVLLVLCSKLKTPKSCVKVHQTLNMKVGDLKPTYNFHKGYMGVFLIRFGSASLSTLYATQLL